ncbi:Hypothetical protein IALB_2498 [Ignavibacterium album JCM 16511]|uniref:Uncharacterized protein n=1 Tax=Ignavibacterium album (strain DSM 19864 / JCM 16511 / NBRC 101810 / Mat9-16) TaxID=945713 RepID=I0AMJ4_IGNAJ|nr:hypothetical protein [Ignavibacterium album]AFH50201.1 Hypothetical protein IALB_2498 [Ignavibacterium album JCM 16511]
MLNKIENITLNPNSRNEIKSSKKESHINHLTKKENFSDTITFSAALLFLSQLKWRLKKINHISTDELEVEIIANDISYSTVINLKEPSVRNLTIQIRNEFPFKHNNSLYEVSVLMNYQKVESFDEEKLYEPVNKLFYRIPSYEYADEKEISSTFYYELLEGVESELLKSLSVIYRNMVQFSDKLTGKNNISIINNIESSEQSIKLNKILINHLT